MRNKMSESRINKEQKCFVKIHKIIREYLKNESDESLEKILDFDVNMIEVLVAEIRLLLERIEEIEERKEREW